MLVFNVHSSTLKKCNLLLTLFIHSIFLFGQNPGLSFNYLSSENGLSDRSVHSITQDKYGFIWVGTSDGLNKFDGYDIKLYRDNPQDSLSIICSEITKLFCDSHGNIWVGTREGICKLIYERDAFIKYTLPQEEFKLESSTIIAGIEETREKELIIVTEEGYIYQLDSELDKFKQLNEKPFEGVVKSIFISGKNSYWLGSKNGIYNYDPVNQRTEHLSPKEYPELHNCEIWDLIEEDGKLWIASLTSGLFFFDLESRKLNSIKFKGFYENFVTSLFIDKDYNFLVGSLSGIKQKKKAGNEFVFCDFLSNHSNKLASVSVNVIFQDDQGTFWIGHQDKGVSYSIHKKQFSNFDFSENDENSNPVTALCEDKKGNIWIGYEREGIDVFNKKFEKIRKYRPDVNDPFSLGGQSIFEIFQDSKQRIWIGTYWQGLQLYDPTNDNFRSYTHFAGQKNGIGGNDIRSIAEDKHGNLWLAIHGAGIDKFNPETKSFTNYRHDPLNPLTSLANDWTFKVFVDSKSQIWVGTTNGLSRFNENDNNFTSWRTVPGDTTSLNNNIIRAIFEDSSSRLWLGTNEGISLFDPATNRFMNYATQRGLPNNRINGILEDNQNNIWLSTNSGVIRFSPGRKANFPNRNYDISDGLISNNFIIDAVLKSKSGKFFFGHEHGITVFFPDSIKDYKRQSRIVFTGFKLFNRDVPVSNEPGGILQKHINETKEIFLKHHQNSLTIEFNAINYSQPNQNQYAYLLDGFDKDWVIAGAKREAVYTNLSPGNYTFYVKASNSDGIWTINPNSIRIKITPPWWRTYYAYIFYLIATLGLLYGVNKIIFLKLEFQQKERLIEKEREIDQLKLKFFTNISHEFRTPLTLILGPIDNLLKSTQKSVLKNQYYLIQRNAKRLLRLVNQLLDLRSLGTGSMKVKVISGDIFEFISEIISSFTYLALRHKIDFKLEQHQKHLQAWFDPDIVEKIMFNLISNAFKYTPDGGIITVSTGIIDRSSEDYMKYEKLIKKDMEKVHANIGKSGVFPALDPGNEKDTDRPDFTLIYLKIADTGIGIKKEFLPFIFDRFYRVNNANLRKQNGTGIGLSLTKELVELHNGQISVNSEYGKGSEFEIILPLENSFFKNSEIDVKTTGFEFDKYPHISYTDPEHHVDINEGTAITKDDGKSILVVDDQQDIRIFIKNTFEQHFNIYDAANGSKGYEVAITINPALIIADIRMPVLDGLELCRLIKNDVRTSHIPVILLTALTSEEDQLRGLKTKADDYVTKPFSPDILREKVNNILHSREILRKKFVQNVMIKPKEITSTSLDEKFLQKAIQVVNENMSDNDFNVEIFAEKMDVDRTHLYRKLLAFTGLNTSDFIRTMRLKHAVKILLSKKGFNISEVAFMAGFNSAPSFTRAFKAYYGKSPSQYSEEQGSSL